MPTRENVFSTGSLSVCVCDVFGRFLMIGGCACVFVVGSLDIAGKLRQAVSTRYDSSICCKLGHELCGSWVTWF